MFPEAIRYQIGDFELVSDCTIDDGNVLASDVNWQPLLIT